MPGGGAKGAKQAPEQKEEPKEEKLVTLEEHWNKLRNNASDSLLKKHLTEELYGQLKDKKSPLGGTLLDCIKSGKNKWNGFIQFYSVGQQTSEVAL